MMKLALVVLFIANFFAFSSQHPGIASLQTHIEQAIKEKPTLSSALAHFVQEILAIDVSEKQIHLLKGGSGKGLSGALIYVVHNEKEEPLLVIKVFPSSQEKEFLDESFALSHFGNLSLKDLSFPYLKGTGTYTIEGKTFFFVGMTHVKGVSLSALLNPLKDNSLSPDKREAYLHTLLPVFGKLGRGLAQFHLINRGAPKSLNPLVIETLRYQAYEWLEASKEDFDTNILQNMRSFIDKSFDHASSISYFSTYIHGDANLGNYFYDKDSDCLTILDFTTAAQSITLEGAPTGTSFYDLVFLKNRIFIEALFRLKLEECSRLYDHFLSEYTRAGGNIPSKEIEAAFSLGEDLDYFRWYREHTRNFDEKARKIETIIYKQKLEALKNQVLKSP